MSTRLRHVEVLDYAQLAVIDGLWSIEDFAEAMRHRNMIGVVAERVQWRRNAAREIQGFVLYRRYPSFVEIVRLAVAPAARRRGIARSLLEQIPACTEIRLSVLDTLLEVHLFLKALGFRAVRVVPDPSRPDEHAYRFLCRAGAPVSCDAP